MRTDEEILDEILRREGDRYTEHPADRGGPTRYGITLDTLRRYVKKTATPGSPARIVTAHDVRMLTEAEAREILRSMYIRWPGFDRIRNHALRGFVVDSGVNHGPDDPIRWMQEATQVKVDGVFGPISAAAVNALEPRRLFVELVARRCMKYGQIVTNDPVRVAATKAGFRTQAENAHGWARRLAEFIRETAVL